jgi:hypothetical protein
MRADLCGCCLPGSTNSRRTFLRREGTLWPKIRRVILARVSTPAVFHSGINEAGRRLGSYREGEPEQCLGREPVRVGRLIGRLGIVRNASGHRS